MKVVHVVPHWSPGGMQEVVRILDEGLPRHGIESEAVALDAVTGRRRGPAGLPAGWAGLVQAWRARRPDAVLAHTVVNAVYSLSAARAAGVRRRVVVVHSSRTSLGEPKTRLLDGVVRSGLATDVVVVGRAAADSFAGVGEVLRERVVVIQNGVRLPEAPADADEPHGAVRSSPDDGPAQVAFAGRLDRGKNLATAIRALARVERACVLHVFGDGTERLPLEALARQVGADVRFHGTVERSALRRAYGHADLFVFPTLGEGLPLALVEVAAAGVPVVSSDLPSTREVLGDAARYCPAEDVDAWASTVQAVLDDPAERERMARAGRERVELFTVDRMVAQYAELLTGPAGHAPSRP